MNPLLRLAAGTAVVATTFTIGHGVAEAHANTVTCIDQSTSTWRITNDYDLAESFTSPQGPSGSVAAGNGSYTDVIYAGDSLQIDAVWSDGFTETRTGTGDCTPEVIVTTTTELVTTTTEQETTTSTTQPATTAPTTSVPVSTTTSSPSTTSPTTTQPSATSSSVATTSTTSEPPTASPTTTTLPSTTPSTEPPGPSSTTPECSDNPNTPTDECGPSLPATGSDSTGYVVVIALGCILLGALTLHWNRRAA